MIPIAAGGNGLPLISLSLENQRTLPHTLYGRASGLRANSALALRHFHCLIWISPIPYLIAFTYILGFYC